MELPYPERERAFDYQIWGTIGNVCPYHHALFVTLSKSCQLAPHGQRALNQMDLWMSEAQQQQQKMMLMLMI